MNKGDQDRFDAVGADLEDASRRIDELQIDGEFPNLELMELSMLLDQAIFKLSQVRNAPILRPEYWVPKRNGATHLRLVK